MIKTKIFAAVAVLLAVFSVETEAKLYKWVDEKGEVHYGEVIPPEYADRERVQIEKGREVRKPEKREAGKQPGKEDPAAVEQRRRDEALLGTFSNEQEIDLARDRNLQQVDARTSSIQMRIKTAQGDLDGFLKEKEGLVKAGKPVPASLQEDINEMTAKVSGLNEELAKSQADAAAVRARYEADKQRFRELKDGDSQK